MSELIYGRRAVLETLRAGRRHVFRLWFEGEPGSRSGATIDQIVAASADRHVAVRHVQGGLFDKLSRQGIHSQGVALEVGNYPYAAVEDCLEHATEQDEQPFLLLLDHLHDPQNLGSLIRTAEAMGVHGVLIPRRRAALVTPAVSSASAGAVEHMLVAQVTNLNREIDELKPDNIWIVGLDSLGQAPPLSDVDLGGGLAVVVGGEGSGLSHLTREKCDYLVRIPMFGSIESLNAAVAGGIVLYSVRQTRRASQTAP